MNLHRRPKLPKDDPNTRAMHWSFVAGVALTLMMLHTGCANKGTPVTFTSDPEGATMRVERLAHPDATAGETIASGRAPLSTRLHFESPATSYRVVAQPSGQVEENFAATTVRYDRDALLAAAGIVGVEPSADDADGPGPMPEGPLRINIPLTQRPSTVMPVLLPVYHPRDGWLAVRTRLRSYSTIVEADGTAPEQVVPLSALAAVGGAERLGQSVGIWGLDISEIDGGRMVTGTFRPASEGLTLDPSDPEAAARLEKVEPDKRTQAMLVSSYRFPIASADLVSLRLNGLSEVRLTTDGHVDVTPAFSPDGQYLLFASNRDQRKRSDIFRRPSIRPGALDVVTRNLPAGGAAWPSQADDGTIAFGFYPEGAESPDAGHIYAKIGGLGGYDSLIVQGGAQPAISPDGQLVAYLSRGDLWLSSIDGSQQRRLTTDAETLMHGFARSSLTSEQDRERFEQFERQWLIQPYRDLAWSDDGRWLAFASLSGTDPEGRPNYDIWLLDLDTGRRMQLTTNGSADLVPRFDASAQEIYFLSNRGQQWMVWKLPLPEPDASDED